VDIAREEGGGTCRVADFSQAIPATEGHAKGTSRKDTGIKTFFRTKDLVKKTGGNRDECVSL